MYYFYVMPPLPSWREITAGGSREYVIYRGVREWFKRNAWNAFVL